jgi:hypothetical protein
VKAKVTVTRDDTAKVFGALASMTRRRVLVGVPSDKSARKAEPITNASLAYIHDNGSPAASIPARPFMLPGIAKARPKAVAVLKAAAAKGFTDSTAVERGLNAAGLICASEIKNVVRSQEGFAPLAASTLASRKRRKFTGTKALIETGQLLNSITYVVRDK